MKIEDEEKLLKQKMAFHHANSVKEKELWARKKQEQQASQMELQEEEGARRCIMKNMMNETENNLSPIKDVLIHFEGKVALKKPKIKNNIFNIFFYLQGLSTSLIANLSTAMNASVFLLKKIITLSNVFWSYLKKLGKLRKTF